ISVDSAQVYRGMDIGSAKPDAATLARVPHHLIDLLDPSEAYSAARFRDDALALIADIRGRGRIPLLVGGTMLYYRALQYGLSDLPAADPEVRARLEQRAADEGWPALHALLAARDPVTAARLHPNDQQRIQRALEIIEISGATPSEFHAQAKSDGLPGRLVKIGLNPASREELHERIAMRFHQMMEQGFLEEVRRLRARGDLNIELPSIRAVGYRQLWEHLDGRDSLPEAIERGIAATRQFAKRQITWLRSEAAVQWLDPASGNLLAEALHLLK
ncbi:MAG: tRNA (adenosine(37)-N6)-dimethylallyltransferase MiaA, partial [Cupriavidus sp.]